MSIPCFRCCGRRCMVKQNTETDKRKRTLLCICCSTCFFQKLASTWTAAVAFKSFWGEKELSTVASSSPIVINDFSRPKLQKDLLSQQQRRNKEPWLGFRETGGTHAAATRQSCCSRLWFIKQLEIRENDEARAKKSFIFLARRRGSLKSLEKLKFLDARSVCFELEREEKSSA